VRMNGCRSTSAGVDSPEMPVGIIVDEVFGFRRFSES
jgi:hypothetical protein